MTTPSLSSVDCIYMDYNATTPIDPMVAQAMLPYLLSSSTSPNSPSDSVSSLTLPFHTYFGNPSSAHSYAKPMVQGLTKAREQVKNLIHAHSPDEIIFNGCASESINSILKGAVLAKHRHYLQQQQQLPPASSSSSSSPSLSGHIVTTAIEHIVVLETCKWIKEHFPTIDITYVSPRKDGRIYADDVVTVLRQDTFLVSVMFTNNETGVINPVKEISQRIRQYNPDILIHTDASQALGKVPIYVNELDVDTATFAGHKLYAPKGIGVTYIKSTVPKDKIESLIHGASQEQSKRAGTENIMFSVGMGMACEMVSSHLEKEGQRLGILRDKIAISLRKECARMNVPIHFHGILNTVPGWSINPDIHDGANNEWLALPNTLSVTFPGSFAADVVHALRNTVAVSAGAACHSHHVGSMEHAHISHVLDAMKVERSIALGTLRLSIGRYSTDEEIQRAVPLIIKAVKESYDKRSSKDNISNENNTVPLSSPSSVTVPNADDHPTKPSKESPSLPSPSSSSSSSSSVPSSVPNIYTMPLFLQDTYSFETTTTVRYVLPVTNEGVLIPTDDTSSSTLSTVTIGPSTQESSYAVLLHATVAHPQGGGQPSDRGIILFTTPILPSTEDEEMNEIDYSRINLLLFQFHSVRWGSTQSVLHYGNFIPIPDNLSKEEILQFPERLLVPLADKVPEVSNKMVASTSAATLNKYVPPSLPLEQLQGMQAHIRIHTEHRKISARLHSAGHLLDLAVRRIYPSSFISLTKTVLTPLIPGKGYHFVDGPNVEYDGVIPPEIKDKFVTVLNQEIASIIEQNGKTQKWMLLRTDPQVTDFGLDPVTDFAHLPMDAPIRIVAIGEPTNTCPCGGTHVKSANEIGKLIVTKIKAAKGKTKVSYVVE